ncbi:PREDICTED: chromosome transmission fidelity protein 8 homolog [Branchiostoma belcheri]|uniref:Chromosome transmission fidelity protein 8 homolog n=1 Tax=Branchiostoma belcheri TaxID=7741 RepID=A0A6P4ZWJ8_BRABE|nr:PREDICTED: chromosome transmission fidelity protein 8 homolog [Branchiostoma belcheri]
MVQFAIRMPQTEGGCPEWTMVELQGVLETRDSSGLPGNRLGDLHFTKGGQPILLIGHHVLHGKVVELEKPFAVLVKEKEKEKKDDSTDSMDTGESADTVTCSDYLVKAVIRNKLVFKNRPRPIINLTHKKGH